ncbi:MAG: HD domain-containing protein [Spirochaetes bacterium]|nr:HD domain-containing protein [Spirochaetota bacterium]
MVHDEKNNRDQTLVHLDIRLIKPGAQYAYDLMDEYGNVILEAYREFTASLQKHLLSENVRYLYYNPALKRTKDAKQVAIDHVVSQKLQGEVIENAKEIFDFLRENYKSSPSQLLTKSKIDASRKLINRVLEEISDRKDEIFNPLMKLKSLDEYDYLHSTNVSILGALLAYKLEFSKEVQMAMGMGGLFHDIGKTSVAKDILTKAKLSDEEFDIVKGHPHVGYKIIENNPYMNELEKQIVILHHERTDSNGYPFGFDLDHIQQKLPREVRLMSICDVYSALVSERPYGKVYSSAEALRLMLNMIYAPFKAIHHFLPPDFRDFIRALGLSLNEGSFFLKPGDLVRLENGEIAIVEEMNRLYPLNPRVRLITDKDKQPLKRQVQVDLLKDYRTYIANVLERNP